MATKKTTVTENLAPRRGSDAQRAAVLAQINKQVPGATLRKLSDRSNEVIPAQSTGLLNLDHLLRIGGLPVGRIVEVFGPAGSGKTTLVGHFIEATQRAGGEAAMLDVEHSLDLTLYMNMGVDLDRLTFDQPDSAEATLESVRHLAASGYWDLVVIDSIADMNPQSVHGKVLTGAGGAGFERAKLLREAMRELKKLCARTHTTLVLVNQTYETPDKGTKTTGGDGPKYAASVRMSTKQWWRKDPLRLAGSTVKILKNKVGGPVYVSVDIPFALEPNSGFDRQASAVLFCIEGGLIEVRGAWHYWMNPETGEEIKLGQGWANAVKYFGDNPGDFALLLRDVDKQFQWVRER